MSIGDRPAYNPLEALKATPAWAYTFLAIRFLGLALVVPIIEEFFLRGFLMRFVQDDQWWQVPFGKVTPLAVVVGTAVPMLMHPAELAGRLRLVQPRHLADDPHQKHLGLRRRPRRHELPPGRLRRHATPVATLVEATEAAELARMHAEGGSDCGFWIVDCGLGVLFVR